MTTCSTPKRLLFRRLRNLDVRGLINGKVFGCHVRKTMKEKITLVMTIRDMDIVIN